MQSRKTSPVSDFDALSGAEALRRIQSQARYLFHPDEFAKLTGREVQSVAVKSALMRLSRQGLITLAAKRPAAWLIVPPEHQHYQAPPVEWWLDDCLKTTEPHYYLALLSAARHWGSSHYALQTTQVMVGRPRKPQAIGQLALEFFFKKDLAKTPVVRVNKAVASVRVSTREATLLDLVRHQTGMGGIEAVARIAKDFSRDLSATGLIEALDALNQAPAAQRLGFVLETLGLAKPASVVSKWLGARRKLVQPLEATSIPAGTATNTTRRWSVEYTQQQETMLKELA